MHEAPSASTLALVMKVLIFGAAFVPRRSIASRGSDGKLEMERTSDADRRRKTDPGPNSGLDPFARVWLVRSKDWLGERFLAPAPGLRRGICAPIRPSPNAALSRPHREARVGPK